MSSKPYGLMADLHLHAWSAFASVTPEGLNSRLKGLVNEIWRCAAEVKAAGGVNIIIAGDVFHVRGSVSPTVLNLTKDTMTAIYKELGVSFVIMPGNHDLEGKETTRLSSAVTGLESDAATVVSGVVPMPGISYAPWIESIEDLKTTLQGMAATLGAAAAAVTDLMIHAPIDGVIKGLPAHGLEPEFLASLGFKRVFAGHYHNHKQVYDGSSGTYGCDVYSIGALAHHTWSDVGTRAGFLIVHPDRVDWRKSHLPEFIDLSQLMDIEPEEIPFLVDRNFVRIKVEVSKSSEVEKARAELMDMGALAVIVQAQPKPPERTSTAARPSSTAGGSLEVSVTNFVNEMPEINAAAVIKAALNVLASVDALGD